MKNDFDISRTDWCGATFDSRQVKPGMLFVALKGEKCDGHAFIDAARQAGAAGIIDGLDALGRAARAYRRSLAARVIGVTGSAGKTTTKEFLRALLATVGKTHATEGNFNNNIGLPITILNCPRDAAFLVTEMGTNHPGEIAALAAVAEPDAGVITGIGTAHLEFFGTRENIAREKGALFEAVKTFGVLPATDPFADLLADLPRGGAVRADPAACPLASPLPGPHNRSNLAVAWECARRFGATEEPCRRALERFALPGDRWRKIERNGVHYISDCYNANPTSMIAALETFAAEPVPGRRVAVLGDMFELGAQSAAFHDTVRTKAAALNLDDVIYVGEAFGGGTLDDARARIKPGDTVLLKASHGMHLERLLDDPS